MIDKDRQLNCPEDIRLPKYSIFFLSGIQQPGESPLTIVYRIESLTSESTRGKRYARDGNNLFGFMFAIIAYTNS